MKKLLISILIILLLVLCGFTVIKGFSIGNFTVLGLSDIKAKNEELDLAIGEATKLASTEYPKALTDIETDLKKLSEEKKNYEDMITVSSDGEVQQASQFQKYEIESLWVKIGNHATSEGVVMKMDLVKTSVENNYNLSFTVNGSYIGITDFITDIENDSQLGFKIEEFTMVPSSSTSDLQATFVCKDITIKDVSNSTVSKPIINNNSETNTDTNNTNQNTTNTNNTNNTKTNNTNNTNSTNTANTSNTTNTSK